jgi:two-component system response regulator MprA
MRPILVVEDDLHLRQTIQWALEDEGLAVETASHGQQALERAAQQRPALVVLDWGLPLLNGQRVADALRAAHGDGLPIVLITADGRAAEKARLVGAYAYLHKPFELDALLAAIQQGLGGS